METVLVLDLTDLERGFPALTESLGRVHAEAAAVCLEVGRHVKPVKLIVREIAKPQFSLNWPDVTEVMRRAYNDLERATELGACGVALLLVRQVTGLKAVQAAKRGGGFDYWLTRDTTDDQLVFQNAARLEVSGILSGTDSQFSSRLKQKLKQTEASDDMSLRAYVVVVEFSQPQAQVAQR